MALNQTQAAAADRYANHDQNQTEISLSIEQTNELRIKLGLKPLRNTSAEDGNGNGNGKKTQKKGSYEEAEKILREREEKREELRRTEELRERINERKQKKMRDFDEANKRKIFDDGGDYDDDAKRWVQKTREQQLIKNDDNEKSMIIKKKKKTKTKNIDSNIENRYEEEEEDAIANDTVLGVYSEKDLRGLKVQRAALDIQNDGEENAVVLTLADKSILDSDSEDELENVAIAEGERAKKNKKLAGKKTKKDEIMDQDEDELLGLKEKKILSKYDDEYADEEKDERFATLGESGVILKDAEEIRKRNARELRLRMAGLVKGDVTTAKVAKDVMQTDAYTKEEEALMKFNTSKKKKKNADKPKKMRKKKKRTEEDSDDEEKDDNKGNFDVSMLEGDDLAKEANAASTHRKSRNAKTKDTKGLPTRDDEAWNNAIEKARDNVDEKILADLAGDRILELAGEEEDELEKALAQARKISASTKNKDRKIEGGEASLFERIAKLEREKPTDMGSVDNHGKNDDESDNGSSKKVLALTDVAEFCRGVGVDNSGDDINTKFVAGRRSSNLKRQRTNHAVENGDDDNEVEDIDWERARDEKLPDEDGNNDAKKNAIENNGDIKMEDDVKKTINPARRNIGLAGILSELKSSGQLEDKGPRWSGRANDLKDHHDRKRALEASGVDVDESIPNSEKQKFNFKLDKYDEFGRTLTPKEAFRELCWKFHGKAPGAKAKEKRLRKYEEEQNALRGGDEHAMAATERMKAVQKQTGDSFVVLSGKISEGQRRNAK